MIKKLGIIFVIFGLTMTLNQSCKKKDVQSSIDRKIIEDYASAHQLNGKFTSSGLYYVIQKPGSSQHPSLSSNVTVNYKGYFLDGKVFDQRTASFLLYVVITGWQEGIPLIGTGGKILLIIPSKLAYGSTGTSGIPPNTVLAFEVSLISFN